MRCYYELAEYNNTIEAAQDVLQMEKIQEEYIREANFKIAKSFHALNEIDFASDFYQKVAYEVNNKEGAESMYRIIEILYNKQELDRAEEEAFKFAELKTPHQYWMGMTLLVLAEVYLDKEDEFSAINTLQNVIDYYPIEDDGIVATARQRRNAIREEAESEIAPEGEPVEEEGQP
jgi:TolA-binding protein